MLTMEANGNYKYPQRNYLKKLLFDFNVCPVAGGYCVYLRPKHFNYTKNRRITT